MVTRAQVGTGKPNPRFHGHTSHNFPFPKSPSIALSDPNWRDAMYDEYNELIRNSTWILVLKPPNVNMVRSMWLFRHKYHVDGSLSRYKARLVANVRSQQFGVDCDETFSPVVKPVTIRIVLSIALSRNWRVHQIDVKNAFLNGDLSEIVYMYQPPGFVESRFPNHVCQLQRSLYGLKQAPRAWFQRFAGAHMDSSNPTRTPVDTESKLSANGDLVSDPTLYRSLAGGLQYLTFTRLDISYAIQQVCLHMHDPR
ncbi:ribonuclease H-like domain-containing protein [Tanacetum coccineum]